VFWYCTAELCTAFARVQRVAAEYLKAKRPPAEEQDALRALCELAVAVSLAPPPATPSPATPSPSAAALDYCAVMDGQRFGHSATMQLEKHYHRAQFGAADARGAGGPAAEQAWAAVCGAALPGHRPPAAPLHLDLCARPREPPRCADDWPGGHLHPVREQLLRSTCT